MSFHIPNLAGWAIAARAEKLRFWRNKYTKLPNVADTLQTVTLETDDYKKYLYTRIPGLTEMGDNMFVTKINTFTDINVVSRYMLLLLLLILFIYTKTACH